MKTLTTVVKCGSLTNLAISPITVIRRSSSLNIETLFNVTQAVFLTVTLFSSKDIGFPREPSTGE